jgi:hypothetical protein
VTTINTTTINTELPGLAAPGHISGPTFLWERVQEAQGYLAEYDSLDLKITQRCARDACKARQCAEQFGQQLAAMKERLGGNTRKMHAFILKYGLNQGAAADPGFRSKCIWLYEHRAELKDFKSDCHNPVFIYQAWRNEHPSTCKATSAEKATTPAAKSTRQLLDQGVMDLKGFLGPYCALLDDALADEPVGDDYHLQRKALAAALDDALTLLAMYAQRFRSTGAATDGPPHAAGL